MNNNGRYILRGHEPVPCEDLTEWAHWYEVNEKRRVALDKVGKSQISTVFLGLDHNYRRKGAPVLFETMVFGGDLDGEMVRYCTWDEAEAGHKRMVERVKTETTMTKGNE